MTLNLIPGSTFSSDVILREINLSHLMCQMGTLTLAPHGFVRIKSGAQVFLILPTPVFLGAGTSEAAFCRGASNVLHHKPPFLT